MVFRRGGPAPQALTRGRPGSRRCGAVVAADRQRPTEFLRVFGELEPEPIEVVVEATYGRGLVRGPAGRCRHPRAYGPSAGHQGDLGRPGHQRRRRGQDLAHLLRTNLLAEAWIAPPAACEARRLVHTRAGLVRMRSRVQAQLPALLADLGIIPELRTLFGPAGRRWLAELQLPATARGRLDAGLRLLDAISVEVGWADGDLRASFAGDDRVRRRLPIPGIWAGDGGHRGRRGLGHPALLLTCAVVFLGRADPWERTSDAHPRRGHTRQAGSRWRRGMLVEAATTAVRDPSWAASPPRSPSATGPRSPSAAGPRSPGWPWPGGCSACARTPCATTAAAVPPRSKPGSRRPVKGALGVGHGLGVQRPPA